MVNVVILFEKFLFIKGEFGIGKIMLVEEFVKSLDIMLI